MKATMADGTKRDPDAHFAAVRTRTSPTWHISEADNPGTHWAPRTACGVTIDLLHMTTASTRAAPTGRCDDEGCKQAWAEADGRSPQASRSPRDRTD